MSTVRMFNYIPECVDLLGACKRILTQSIKSTLIDYSQRGTTYTIRYRIGNDKVSFLISYGKSKPNRCYDRVQEEYDDNILSDKIIHMTNEFIFVVYQDRVLCSDHSKRNLILNLLNSADRNFSCKLLSIVTSIEDFIKNVKTIDSISIEATNNLFINEFLNPHWSDDFEERETPERSVIKMDFGRALKAQYLIKLYKKLRKESYIASFNIKGVSEDGFISINEESVVAKDVYDLEKEEGYYDIEEIFEKI